MPHTPASVPRQAPGKAVGALLRMLPLPRIQAGNCPKMPPGGSAISAQGASLRQVTQSTHFEKGCLSVRPSPLDGKVSPMKLLLAVGGAPRLPFRWLAQCWKRGELMWGWWKECVAYSTSGGGGGDVRMEQSGSWELSIEAKCFISSVSCLISRRRAAFCLSRSSLS